MKSTKTDPIQGEILHEYDGILEADNQLPQWWLVCLFGTIVFGAGYWGWFEVFHVTPGPEEAYAAVMAERALSGGEPTADVLAVIADDRDTVSAGARTFASQCAVCHGPDGSGVIGPNLTDDAWIHGGEPLDVYRTVRDGVGTRGMPTWGPVLGPRGVLEVAAYVLSIRGTNLPGRAPEGVVGGEAHAAADEATER